jgi:hypothetical protein
MKDEIIIDGITYIRKPEPEKKPDRWIPEIGQVYWTELYGHPYSTVYKNDESDQTSLRLGNVHPTREACERHIKRMESLAQGYQPEKGDMVWVWGFFAKQPACICFTGADTRYQFVPKFRTEEECAEWGKTFSDFWINR